MSLGSDEAMEDDEAFSGGSQSDATSEYSDDDGIVVDPPVIRTDRGGSHDSEPADFQVSFKILIYLVKRRWVKYNVKILFIDWNLKFMKFQFPLFCKGCPERDGMLLDNR